MSALRERAGRTATVAVAVGIGAVGIFGGSPATAGVRANRSTPVVSASKSTSHWVFAQINRIRSQLGLPPGTITHRFDRRVLLAARTSRDPITVPLPKGTVSLASIWGAESVSVRGHGAARTRALLPRAVVNGWVSFDGWLGPGKTINLECTSAGAPGCDGHRDTILSPAPVPGARLSIDVGSVETRSSRGVVAISVAAVFAWSMPSSR
jgi:hypothetical protein